MLDEEQHLALKRMQRDADELSAWCLMAGEAHGNREHQLRQVETVLVWATAICAVLSAVSLLADLTGLTIGLTLLIVFLAVLNAAFRPSQRSSNHRDATSALAAVGAKYWVLARYRLPSAASSKATKREFNQLVTDYEAIDEERAVAMAKSPHIDPFRSSQDLLAD
jgi:hypothetical protein